MEERRAGHRAGQDGTGQGRYHPQLEQQLPLGQGSNNTKPFLKSDNICNKYQDSGHRLVSEMNRNPLRPLRGSE